MQLILSARDLFEDYCTRNNKWGLILNYTGDDQAIEVRMAAPYLSEDDSIRLACDNNLYLFYNTQREVMISYDQTVGDHGPTKDNKYAGPARIYASVYSPRDGWMTENT